MGILKSDILNSSKIAIQILVDKIEIPAFWLWKWSKKDYKKSLKLVVDDCRVDFYFLLDSFLDNETLRDRQMPMRGKIVITIDKPDELLLDGLKNPTGKNSQLVAEKVFDIYNSTIQKVASYSRWAADLPNVMEGFSARFEEMFGSKGILRQTHVYWRVGGNEFKSFEPKLKKTKRKINPIFKSKYLLTTKKWQKIINFAQGNTSILSKEIEELLQIKSKAAWSVKRIPVIETAALMEVVIRNKVQIALERQGQSKKKIEGFNEDAGFSTLLNLLLPLILTKTDVIKYKKYINNLDKLRKIRNNIMHKNIQDDDIDQTDVIAGIEAAIKITKILNKRFSQYTHS